MKHDLRINHNAETFSDSFGVPGFHMGRAIRVLTKAMLGIALGDDLNDDEAEPLRLLDSFLASDEAKKLGLPLDSANDYFLLGLIFSYAVSDVEAMAAGLTKSHERDASPLNRMLESVLERAEMASKLSQMKGKH